MSEPGPSKIEKKLSTKEMILKALTDLHSRKGASFHAIKSYIKENFNMNTEKYSYLIKGSLKTSVEDGTIIQTKGTGATGSFKINKIKMKQKTLKKERKVKSEKVKADGDVKEKKSEQPKGDKKTKSGGKEKTQKTEGKKKRTKAAVMALAKTDAKKRASIIKRKSLGSIIKTPKMKPKK